MTYAACGLRLGTAYDGVRAVFSLCARTRTPELISCPAEAQPITACAQVAGETVTDSERRESRESDETDT